EFLVQWESVDEVPDWPGGNSGVTWGVGWDAGQHSRSQLESDWEELDDDVLTRLAKMIGKRGNVAAALVDEVSDIAIPRDMSLSVFQDKTLPSFYALTMQTFPGAVSLPLGVQAALISLVYNRGASLKEGDDARLEMRKIHDAVQKRDLLAIYTNIG